MFDTEEMAASLLHDSRPARRAAAPGSAAMPGSTTTGCLAGRGVHPWLRPLFPQGLRAGVHELDGPLTIGLALLAGSDWSAVVGQADVGVEAVLEWGLSPEKLILIPDAGPDWLGVVAELIEIADTVLVRPPGRVSEMAAQRLVARLRHRNAALVVAGPWPRSQSQVRVRVEGWAGLGSGHGQLTEQHVDIEVIERHRTRRHRLVRAAAA